MTYSKLLSGVAILAIAAMLLTLPVAAHADTFQIFALDTDNNRTLYGIDTAGDVVIQSGPSAVCGMLSSCFETFVNGLLSSVSPTAPSLAYDNGTPCLPAPNAIRGVCNNGREAFSTQDPTTGVFTGPNPVAELQSGVADIIVMNASGDIAWADSSVENIYEAIDLTSDHVPEPNTLVLLGTGVFGAVGVLRRRLVRR
jgi:hypothetical protein